MAGAHPAGGLVSPAGIQPLTHNSEHQNSQIGTFKKKCTLGMSSYLLMAWSRFILLLFKASSAGSLCGGKQSFH